MIKESFIPLISFEKINHSHQEIIFQWLNEPHMQEFWDNSQEHKDDIISFINGRVSPSNYFNGIFTYWVGIVNSEPFCLIMTAEVNKNESHHSIWINNLSSTGRTYSLDFGIGNTHYLGKKLAAPTLKLFTEFFHNKIDSQADTFYIDPAQDNPRAKHVYEKAGFKEVGLYEMKNGVFKGENTVLMVLKMQRAA